MDLSRDSAALRWGASDFAALSTPARPAAASGEWRGSRGGRWAAEALRNQPGFEGGWTGLVPAVLFFSLVSVTLARSFDLAGPSVSTCKTEWAHLAVIWRVSVGDSALTLALGRCSPVSFVKDHSACGRKARPHFLQPPSRTWSFHQPTGRVTGGRSAGTARALPPWGRASL